LVRRKEVKKRESENSRLTPDAGEQRGGGGQRLKNVGRRGRFTKSWGFETVSKEGLKGGTKRGKKGEGAILKEGGRS